MKHRLGWVIVVMAVAVAPALAARNGNIRGTVRDARGVAQMGATVEIISQAPAADLFFYTDRKGRFEATDLVPGKYQIKASAASFLPTLRENVGLRPGAELVVNLTLNTLFEALQMMPVRSRTAEDQDDWKWTLRSMANRPILRVMDGDPLVVVSAKEGQNDRALKARVEFVAGAKNSGMGSSDQQATTFALDTSLFSSDTLRLNGNVGRAFDAPAVLRLSYAHQFANGERPELAVTARRFYIGTAGNDHAALDAFGVALSNQTRLTDFAELEYGGEYQTIQFLGRAAAFRPHGTLDVHLSPNTVFEYRYATSLPSTRLEKGFDSAPADLSESGPRVSMTALGAQLENAHHQEISISQRIGASSFQLAGFSDRIRNLALIGLGDDPNDDASGALLADPYSQSFSYFGNGLSTGGVRAVAERNFSALLKGTLDVAYGGTLALDGSQPVVLGRMAPEFAHRRQVAVATKLAGRVPKTRTSWLASYKWNSGSRVLTPVDEFNGSAGEADPYLNVFIRQPLPAPGFLPGQMEALVDLRNLLAQGYVPVLGQDGHTLYLVQSARSIRGGLAFNF
jgi:hypothetical protein